MFIPLNAQPRRRMGLEQGVVIAGKYELERELGKGGMGAVWLARHVELGERRVAVKFLLNACSPQMLERFRREALIASQIQTRHAVGVMDFGVHEGAPYLAMEYLKGQDVRGLLDKQQRLEPSMAVSILMQAARGLQKAHEAGLIHRDIKPENLFLTTDEDGALLVKILDFGIAKSQSVDSGTATGMMIGTVYYMSPEQFQGLKTIDHRTDLWSLACVGYEMLVGTRPFDGTSVMMIGMTVMGQERPVPSRVLPGLPPALDAWFAKALHPDIHQRFTSAPELAAAFASALGGASGSVSVSAAGVLAGSTSGANAFMTTGASAVSEVDSRSGAAAQRRATIWLAGLGAAVVVAGIGVGAFVALRSNNKAQGSGLAASADSAVVAPSMTASAAAEPSMLDGAVAQVRAGDLGGAHRLLADVASDSPMRADKRFAEVENAWAERQLTAAQGERDEGEKARMLTEVTKSGADEAMRKRASSMIDAMSKPRTAGKGGGEAKVKAAPKAEPPATAAPQPTPVLPQRF
jgi:hypothetical protein